MTGTVSEEESYKYTEKLLQQENEQKAAQYETYKDNYNKMKNDSDTMQRIYEANPHFEREYIFDESVGISLETHVSDLKKNPAI